MASRPGEGSTFTVYLPRAEAPARPARRAVAGAPAAPGGSETVLVVEDEDAVRHLVCRVLRAKGYRVLSAATPRRRSRWRSATPSRSTCW